MALTETPICNFGENAKEFSLVSTDNVTLSLNDFKGEKGTLIISETVKKSIMLFN